MWFPTLVKAEISKIKKAKDLVSRKLTSTEEMRTDLDRQKEQMRQEIGRLEQEKTTALKQADVDKKAIEDLVRERDLINKNLIKAAGQTQKQLNLVRLHEQDQFFIIFLRKKASIYALTFCSYQN